MKLIELKLLEKKADIPNKELNWESKLTVQIDDRIFHAEFSLADHVHNKLRIVHSEGKMKEQMRLELAKRIAAEVGKHVYSVIQDVRETTASDLLETVN